jgi:hypothetical protein
MALAGSRRHWTSIEAQQLHYGNRRQARSRHIKLTLDGSFATWNLLINSCFYLMSDNSNRSGPTELKSQNEAVGG